MQTKPTNLSGILPFIALCAAAVLALLGAIAFVLYAIAYSDELSFGVRVSAAFVAGVLIILAGHELLRRTRVAYDPLRDGPVDVAAEVEAAGLRTDLPVYRNTEGAAQAGERQP